MALSKPGTDAVSDAASPPGETGSIADQLASLHAEIAGLRAELTEVSRREAELRTMLARETELDAHMDRLENVLRKKTLAERITAAIAQAPMRTHPCPYTVVDGVLPVSLYDALLMGIPPTVMFERKPAGKQHMDVPFPMAPLFSRRIWRFMATEILPNVVGPAVLAKFRSPIDEWIRINWPTLDPESVELRVNAGRVMFRRRGYRIRPHRDPKWGFLTCILYLARPGDDASWGTQMYAVDDDQEADSAAPYWIDETRCRLVEDVRFLPNRLFVFLNSTGAHGAHIPADAQPPDLERFIYQFRIGPNVEAAAKLKSMLPEDRRELWAGKALTDY
jgi:hypothetical protein